MTNKIKLKIDSLTQRQIRASYKIPFDAMKFSYIVTHIYDNLMTKVNYFCYINKYEESSLRKVHVYELDKN